MQLVLKLHSRGVQLHLDIQLAMELNEQNGGDELIYVDLCGMQVNIMDETLLVTENVTTESISLLKYEHHVRKTSSLWSSYYRQILVGLSFPL